MAVPAKKLYWITAAIFFMVVVLSFHKSNSILPNPNQNNEYTNNGQQPNTNNNYNHNNNNNNNNNNYNDNKVDDTNDPYEDHNSPLFPVPQPVSDSALPNTSNQYDTLIVIPSSWTQMQNRQWVRETIFGIENNLEPCKNYDGRIIYKFYIHGLSTWANTKIHTAQFMQALVRDLHGEFMEYDDSFFANKTVTDRHAVWGDALDWAVNKFIPDNKFRVDKVLIFDSTTLVNLPDIETAIRGVTAPQGYLYTWGETTTFAAAGSFAVIKDILTRRPAIKAAFTNANIIEGAIQHLDPPSFKVLKGLGELWASDIEQVSTAAHAVGQIYQREDWTPVARKLAIKPTAACAVDKNRMANIAVLTSSYIYADMCMAEASLPAAENKRIYAHRHGYDFVARGAEFAQEEFRGRRPVWGKIGAIQKVLPHYEWLFWMDMDAIIADLGKDLREIIEYAEEQHNNKNTGQELSLIVAQPKRDKMLNAGVMLIKNTDWSRKFFNEVQTRSAWYHTRSYEQAAIWEVMTEPKWAPGVYNYAQDDHTMNTFPNLYNEGDFVIHFAPAGCPAVPVLEALAKIKNGDSAKGIGTTQ
ncbi:hypothetical protein BGZ74_009298 [Mortierella antarctica]|nr:hypothetical protein BGZ74_009298 [Mortierella antarctica]